METREFYLRPKRNTFMKENDNYTRELLTFDLIKANLMVCFQLFQF
jgi:hypothetical protein